MLRLAFDSGTILLHGLGQSLAPSLPGVRWDPRVRTFRAAGHRYRDIVLALLEAGESFVDEVQSRGAPPLGWSEPELRPYQHAALASWDGAQRAGMVVLPTGSGKTRLALAAIAGCGTSALCLVPTRSLLHQWSTELARFYAGPVGRLGDGEHRIEAVTVATFEGAFRNMSRLGNRFDLLIIDEVHHFGAGIRDEALELCTAPCRLGLTATAPDGEALQRIEELVGPIFCELSIADLAGEWLAAFDSVVLMLRLSQAEQRRYDRAVVVFREVFDSVSSVQQDGTVE